MPVQKLVDPRGVVYGNLSVGMIMRGCALVLLSCLGCGDNSSCVGVCTAPSWTTLELVAGQPGGCGYVDGTPLTVHFDSPSAVTSDGAGHLYVLEDTTIRSIDQTTGLVSTFAGTYGVHGAIDGALNSPAGIIATPTTLYLADTENNALRTIDVATKQTTIFAGDPNAPGDANGVGTAAHFREPEGIVLVDGQLYIADTDNDTIRVMDLATGAVSTLAGVPQTDGTDNGVGAMARFNRPAAMVFDGAHGLFVADRLNLSVRHVDVSNAMVSTVTTFDSAPQGLALVGNQLFVSVEDGRVFAVDVGTAAMTLVAGAMYMPGFVDGMGTDARFKNPFGLHALSSDSILVADSRACALRTLGVTDRVVSTVWGSNPEGTADGVGTAARFGDPEGVVVAPGGTIYVADHEPNDPRGRCDRRGHDDRRCGRRARHG